jgi:hypothetical protein
MYFVFVIINKTEFYNKKCGNFLKISDIGAYSAESTITNLYKSVIYYSYFHLTRQRSRQILRNTFDMMA